MAPKKPPPPQYWGAMRRMSHEPGMRRRVEPGSNCPLCKKALDYGQTMKAHQASVRCAQGQGRIAVEARGLARALHNQWILGSDVEVLRGDQLHVGLVPHHLYAVQWAVELSGYLEKLITVQDRLLIENGEPCWKQEDLTLLSKAAMNRALVDERWRRAVMASFKMVGAADTAQLLQDVLPPGTELQSFDPSEIGTVPDPFAMDDENEDS